MNKILLLFLFLLAGCYAISQNKFGRPNVIIIISDDQGYGDYSINGNPVLETPALDRLATDGVALSDFHVSPQCTPSRGQLLSGMDALHNQAATVGAGRNTMRRDIVTLPEVFRQNGYSTGIFGKWHLGDNYPDRPMDRGFDKFVWFHGWGLFSEYEYDNDYYRTRYLDGEKTIQSEQYCTDLWFSKAIDWMGEMADNNQPFFAYIPTNAPHGPFLAPEEDFEYYKDKVESASVAAFFGMLRNIDKNVEKLDKWLDKRKLKDNTIVIYMNDNGGTGGVRFYNAGMRGQKGDVYEGGHRAACFIRWPAGKLSGGRTVSVTSEVQDIFPTLVDLLGLRQDASRSRLDGVSLAPALRRKGNIKDRMFVVQFAKGAKPEKYSGCVVWNDWRLIGNSELYNIKSDPGQQADIKLRHPDIFRMMLSFYDNWWDARQPEVESFVPIFIGSLEQPVTILTSDFWADADYVNTRNRIAAGQGPSGGGIWHIKVLKDGIYQLELSRWPFHLAVPITSTGPDTTVGGLSFKPGLAFDIFSGCISVNGNTIVKKKSDNSTSKSIIIETRLTKSDSSFRAWFKDAQDKDICGAYFVRVRFLRNR